MAVQKPITATISLLDLVIGFQLSYYLGWKSKTSTPAPGKPQAVVAESLPAELEPESDAEFRYGPRGGHGWSPYSTRELYERMAAHAAGEAPPADGE